VGKFSFGLAVVVMGCAAAPQPGAGPQAAPPLAASAQSPGTPTTHSQQVASQTAAPSASESANAICIGTIDSALQHQIAERAAQGRSCYENLLRRDPKREGRLVVILKLSGTGTIDSAGVSLDELADPETSECVLGYFKAPFNGSITDTCVVVNVPLRFKLKKPESSDSSDAKAPAAS